MTAGEAMCAPDFVLEEEAMAGEWEAELELDRRKRNEEMRRQEELARIEEERMAAAAASAVEDDHFPQSDSKTLEFDPGKLDVEITLCGACESILRTIDLCEDDAASCTVDMCTNDDCDQAFESDPNGVSLEELR